MNSISFRDGSSVTKMCCNRNIDSATNCILPNKHTGPHMDGNIQWSDAEPDTLDSNYDIAAREAKDPTPAPAWKGTHTPDEEAMRKTFLEKCKPFLPGVKVWTAYGKGEIVDVLNVADQYCPYQVLLSDGQTHVFKRENLSMNPQNAPKTPLCICGTVTNVHHHECPCYAYVVPVQQSMQCRFTMEPYNRIRCLLAEGHKGECDFGIGSQSGKLVPLVERKPIQIAVVGINNIFALCNDGTIWQAISDKPWTKLAAIPQD